MHFVCLQKDENGKYAKCFQCNDIVTQFDKHCDITNRWVHYNCWLTDKSGNYARCTLCGGIVLGKDERNLDKIDKSKYVHRKCPYVKKSDKEDQEDQEDNIMHNIPTGIDHKKTDKTDHTLHELTGMHMLISKLQRCNPYAV